MLFHRLIMTDGFIDESYCAEVRKDECLRFMKDQNRALEDPKASGGKLCEIIGIDDLFRFGYFPMCWYW